MSNAPSSHEVLEARLLDVSEVAELLRCSKRHVYRLSESGRMPAPLKLGHLIRWRDIDVQEWIAAGCPSVPREAARR